MNERLAVEPILSRLRDFQRRTVEYVFQRMYLDTEPTRRFLVADEVGLGKTMVARGVIAKTIRHLQEKGEKRIDIIYVCSNAAIARQNLNRLNVYQNREFGFATRLTLLPAQLRELKANRINFVSLTPGTTFDLKAGAGIKEERRVLYQMLRERFSEPEIGLRNLLRASAGREGWPSFAEQPVSIDRELKREFLKELWADSELLCRLRKACRKFRKIDDRSLEDWRLQYSLAAALRAVLAGVCIGALEPDLVILDEFQRFKELLDGNSEAAQLARKLFEQKEARVLLLSATPYKMLTLNHETDEDHYQDFRRTVEFLFGSSESVAELEATLARFRNTLHGAVGCNGESESVRASLENKLRKVMVRSERVPVTEKGDAMVEEPPVPVDLKSADLRQAVLTDRVAQELKSWNAIEYWKSSPYLLNLMKEYDLKRLLRDQLEKPSQGLLLALEKGKRELLRQRDFERYRDFEPANGRLRALIKDTVGSGQSSLLWVPPSLPYWQSGEAYREQQSMTKALVFSCWQVVPDAIAVACSYEAERAMMSHDPEIPKYSLLGKVRRPLLRFSASAEERLNGMPVLSLLYPSPTLAQFIDPIGIALDSGGNGNILTIDDVKKRVTAGLQELLGSIGQTQAGGDGRADQRWYWAALALLDARYAPWIKRWCLSTGPEGWRQIGDRSDDETDSGFARHVEHFAEFFEGPGDLGRQPDDLLEVLAEIALGSPAVCSLRSLRRTIGWVDLDEEKLLQSAARVGEGFRYLFNLPQAMALLRADDTGQPYWRRTLHHALEGNLASVLDEYFHWLKEAQGVMDRPAGDAVKELGEIASEAVSVRTSVLEVDEVRGQPQKQTISLKPFRVRCRFAMRFSSLRSDQDDKLARAENVQKAFNSPFRPFVLATTSIGQEGLDFHPYCHRVYHWNLPGNPVDLEQREGRIHRYKGHAIRKNVAERHGLGALAGRYRTGDDPWLLLFEAASKDRAPGISELFPYWVYPAGSARVERRVLMLPFSREQQRLPDLKASLAVYRLVFGQPRQEDLIAHLKGRPPEQLAAWRISLAPPACPDSMVLPDQSASPSSCNGSQVLYCRRCGEAVAHECNSVRGNRELHWQTGDQLIFLLRRGDDKAKSAPDYRRAAVQAVNGNEARVGFTNRFSTLRYRGGSLFLDLQTRERFRLVAHHDISGGATIGLICVRCGGYRSHSCTRDIEPFHRPWQPGQLLEVSYSPAVGAPFGLKPGPVPACLVRAAGSVARVHLQFQPNRSHLVHLALTPSGTWLDIDNGVRCKVRVSEQQEACPP